MINLKKTQTFRKCTKLDSLEIKEVWFLAGPFLIYTYDGTSTFSPQASLTVWRTMQASTNAKLNNSFSLIWLWRLGYVLVAEDPIFRRSSVNYMADP